jgi:ammonia channel protein AmtB
MDNIENSIFWDILKWMASIGGSLVAIGIGTVFWFLRDYSLRFHETIKVLFQRFRELEAERAAKWKDQNDFCRNCFALVNRAIEIARRRNNKTIS